MSNKIINFFDSLPYVVKIILAIPFLDGIAYGIYRIAKGNVLKGIIWIVLGVFLIGSILDIYTLITDKKISIWA